jgi:hypothetical protein
MQKTRTLVVVLLPSLSLPEHRLKTKPQLTVEVLRAETVHWTTYWHDSGSAGKTTPECCLPGARTS